LDRDDFEIKTPAEIITYRVDEGSEGLFRAAEVARAENDKREKEHQERYHHSHNHHNSPNRRHVI
jgi:hypothetical protein